MRSALLCASSAERIFYISRLSRSAERDKRIFTGGVGNELPQLEDFPTEKGCPPGGRQPFPEENKENTRPKGLGEYQNILSSL
jgi:hypothetical protein